MVTADLKSFGTDFGKVSVTIVVIIEVLPTPSKQVKAKASYRLLKTKPGCRDLQYFRSF